MECLLVTNRKTCGRVWAPAVVPLHMEKIYITGLGWATSIGSTPQAVDESLRNGLTGIRQANWGPPFECPIKLWAPVQGFSAHSEMAEDWNGPEGFTLPMEVLRSIPPSGFYAFWSVREALKNSGLARDQISDGRTGLYSASSGSSQMLYRHMKRLMERGPMSSSPLGVLASVVGTLNFNLAAYYKITGHSCGFASACASSGHALGFAFDALRAGLQDRMVVLGAEDDTPETILPFASMRVLTQATNFEDFRGPFDVARSGFVGTGGAVAMILERESAVAARGGTPLAELAGWGQSTDGYHPAKPQPEGRGLLLAMKNALNQAGVDSYSVDYLNAHATGTLVGDSAELKALNVIFGDKGPWVSSTKGQTGHGLSLASILELGIAVWVLKNNFLPTNLGLKSPDPLVERVKLVKAPMSSPIKVAMSNSSGFGGANVSLVIKKI